MAAALSSAGAGRHQAETPCKKQTRSPAKMGRVCAKNCVQIPSCKREINLRTFPEVICVQSLHPLLCVLRCHQFFSDASHTYETTDAYIEFIRQPTYESDKLRIRICESMLENSYVVSMALLFVQKFAQVLEMST